MKVSVKCLNCGEEIFRSAGKIKRTKNRFCNMKCRCDYLKKPEVIKTRFMSHVKIIDENTWVWQGCKNSQGYGLFSINGDMFRAHRIAYQLFVGEIPENFCVCHKFDNTNNVCPNSLWAGT